MGLKVRIVESGMFKLDGGAMFGVVPKSMWQKLNPATDDNLCPWSMRSLLIESDTRKILVDTGIGNKQGAKFRSHFYPFGKEVVDSLGEMSVHPEEITDVFLTHFHFDHVGGALEKLEDGKIVPVFPNAKYWTNQQHYDWAYDANPREAASFLKENFVPLKEQGYLNFINEQKDDVPWIEDISIRFVHGHTRSQMVLKIPLEGEKKLYYGADLVPSRWHIRKPYIMSYDLFPMTTMEEKIRWLDEAVEHQHVVIFEHDPDMEAATIDKSERGRYMIKQGGNLVDFL